MNLPIKFKPVLVNRMVRKQKFYTRASGSLYYAHPVSLRETYQPVLRMAYYLIIVVTHWRKQYDPMH